MLFRCCRCHGINLYQLYPWVHQCDNNLDTKDQLASIYFPDVNLSESIPNDSPFSMVAGDFLEVSEKARRNFNVYDVYGHSCMPRQAEARIFRCLSDRRCLKLIDFAFQVYTKENDWDCVSTCFFIDCANNILAFIEAIYKILRPGK